jgi:hypothetical protein
MSGPNHFGARFPGPGRTGAALAMAGAVPAAGFLAAWLVVLVACVLVTTLTMVRWGRLRASERRTGFPRIGS